MRLGHVERDNGEQVPDFANSKVAYQVFRKAFGSLAKTNSFKRVPQTEASWYKSLPTGDNIEFTFLCDRWGSSDSGNEFNVYLYCSQFIGSVKVGKSGCRSSSFSALLGADDLNEMEKIQNKINARRPFPQDPIYSPGDDLYSSFMSHFQPVKPPYVDRVGSQISFSYYSIQDLSDWVEFILCRLFTVIEKYSSSPGFCADPWLKLITGR